MMMNPTDTLLCSLIRGISHVVPNRENLLIMTGVAALPPCSSTAGLRLPASTCTP